MAAIERKTFPTRIDIPEEDRRPLGDLLNAQLADALDLYTQVKQAHWNVKGPQFIALHELYDEIAADVLAHVDEIAERATALGGVALGTVRMAAAATRLAEWPAEAFDGEDTAAAVADRLAAFGESTRRAIDEADDLGDAATADLFTEVSRAIDKHLWFVEAHIQA
jgi:starvation-inducible DNA-binding protein